MSKYKLTALQQITINFVTGVFLVLAIVFATITALSSTLLENKIKTDLFREAEEIVTQYMRLEDDRITYFTEDNGQTLEQDLTTDQLSAMVTTQEGESIGKFGFFAAPEFSENEKQALLPNIESACSGNTYFYARQSLQKENALLLYYPILAEGRCRGVVIIASNTQLIDDMSRINLIAISFALGIALILALFIARITAKKILHPLTSLTTTIKQIDLSRSQAEVVSPYAKEDEITSLISSYNALAKKVATTVAQEKEFASKASHELKTPLARVTTTLDILSLDLESITDPSVRIMFQEKISVAQQELKSIGDTISLLLQATRAKNLPQNHERIKISQLIAHEVRSMAKEYRNKDITVQHDVAPYAVFADKLILTHIFRNCFSNAYKHNKPKGSIQISYAIEGNTIEVSIQNSILSTEGTVKDSHKIGSSVIETLCTAAGYTTKTRRDSTTYEISIGNIPLNATLPQ
ncbi:MAG: sensor histidine kinase [Patescibacteria group bacterium]